jgi:putative transposase
MMRPLKYKTRKRYETLGELRFLTFSCYQHLPLFNNDAIKLEFVRALDDARKRTNYRIVAWVIMPSHAHLLVAPSLPQYPVPVFLTYLKAPFAKKVLDRWKELNAPILRRLTDRRGNLHFWQIGGGYDRNISSEREYDEKFDYIHLNAARAGLVDDPADWRWSSLPWYLGKPSVLPLD